MDKDKPDRPFPRFPRRSPFHGTEMRQVGLAFAIPGMLLAGPLIGYGFGWLAVTYLGWPDWVCLVGLAFGFVSGVRESVLALRKLTDEQEREKNASSDD